MYGLAFGIGFRVWGIMLSSRRHDDEALGAFCIACACSAPGGETLNPIPLNPTT